MNKVQYQLPETDIEFSGVPDIKFFALAVAEQNEITLKLKCGEVRVRISSCIYDNDGYHYGDLVVIGNKDYTGETRAFAIYPQKGFPKTKVFQRYKPK